MHLPLAVGLLAVDGDHHTVGHDAMPRADPAAVSRAVLSLSEARELLAGLDGAVELARDKPSPLGAGSLGSST